MDKEIDLSALKPLPLDLGSLGVVTEADLVMPGVYGTILENPETGLAIEAFVVLKDAPDISETAKGYGKSTPARPGLLLHRKRCVLAGNGAMPAGIGCGLSKI